MGGFTQGCSSLSMLRMVCPVFRLCNISSGVKARSNMGQTGVSIHHDHGNHGNECQYERSNL